MRAATTKATKSERMLKFGIRRVRSSARTVQPFLCLVAVKEGRWFLSMSSDLNQTFLRVFLRIRCIHAKSQGNLNKMERTGLVRIVTDERSVRTV
jgi:hypothetical protein